MIRLGILGCADIAYRRFMPAVNRIRDIEVIVVGEEYAQEKLELFCSKYGLEGCGSFETIISRDDINAVYIPLPPALHYNWSKRAMECGKHVLVEKPSTTEYFLSLDLIELARAKGLAFHENYMFQYHSQLSEIEKMLKAEVIGEIRLIRLSFGFPMRAQNDFRYKRNLGGGALLDAGGYAVRLAARMLGDTVKVDAAQLNSLSQFEVDMYGSATLSNDAGIVCQIGFGMDCSYQCKLEVWGSAGYLYTDRIFTAPDGYEPTIIIESSEGRQEIKLKADSHFQHSIEHFVEEIKNSVLREDMYEEILVQAKLVDDIRQIGERSFEVKV